MHRSPNQNKTPELPQVSTQWDRWKRMVRESPEVRGDKIAHSRTAIASGEYETDSVMDETLDKMMDAMGVRFHD